MMAVPLEKNKPSTESDREEITLVVPVGGDKRGWYNASVELAVSHACEEDRRDDGG